MSEFLGLIGAIFALVFLVALLSYMAIGFAVGMTWPFWVFT